MTTSQLHTQPLTERVSQAIVGADTEGLGNKIRPVRYRYVMADIRTGKVIAVLPMTQVTYSVGIYIGTDLSGTVYLPEFRMDLMAHPPGNQFLRKKHPDQSGLPLGSLFEVGNVALYVMRNEAVVWGGILWSRSYSSSGKTMSITGLSWDGYLYYRLLRQTVAFNSSTPAYKIWRAVLAMTLADWRGQNANTGLANDGTRHPGGSTSEVVRVPWTGMSHDRNKANADARDYIERWPNNSPNIELPPSGLVWKYKNVEVKTIQKEDFRGYDMKTVGEALQEWADTETFVSGTAAGSLQRFEYRVVCWWDAAQEKFRQRWVFGEMEYGSDPNTPTGIARGKFGQTHDDAENTVFDFPGHISEWSLTESMEDAATRVICTDGGDQADKHAEYASQSDMLLVPATAGANDTTTKGSQGWLLYDRVLTQDSKTPSTIKNRATRMLELCHVPVAAQINDIENANSSATQRASQRSTELTVSLYQDPTTTFPAWKLGDWVTFAIDDPFYGGKMYLQRRIVGYTVSVVPDMESDYSHEGISLELTDDTKIEEG